MNKMYFNDSKQLIVICPKCGAPIEVHKTNVNDGYVDCIECLFEIILTYQ